MSRAARVAHRWTQAVSTPALPVGTRLQGGLYSVGKVLGQGGFGITYLGSDVGLKRAVAIKEFFPQVQGCSRNGTKVQPGGMTTQAEYLDEKNKFLAEGQRLAQFQHPQIVKVFSLFEENNTAYMVMELLKGKTLLRIIEEHGPLEETEAVAYITQSRSARGNSRLQTAPSRHQAREHDHYGGETALFCWTSGQLASSRRERPNG